ncbi:acyl-CoA dehydrogenase, partial [Sesbania bispinosa]
MLQGLRMKQKWLLTAANRTVHNVRGFSSGCSGDDIIGVMVIENTGSRDRGWKSAVLTWGTM